MYSVIQRMDTKTSIAEIILLTVAIFPPYWAAFRVETKIYPVYIV